MTRTCSSSPFIVLATVTSSSIIWHPSRDAINAACEYSVTVNVNSCVFIDISLTLANELCLPLFEYLSPLSLRNVVLTSKKSGAVAHTYSLQASDPDVTDIICRYQTKVVSHPCISAADNLKGRNQTLYEESRVAIREVVKMTASSKHGQEGKPVCFTDAQAEGATCGGLYVRRNDLSHEALRVIFRCRKTVG
ncbi:hypothetical protein BDR04DRAFT_1097934 [Suillus decipiens]|nr:hypothetical protein BDR04DRAFT_1097934 [Suillus decipiens]